MYCRESFEHSPRRPASQPKQITDFLSCLFSHRCAHSRPQPLPFDKLPQNAGGRSVRSRSTFNFELSTSLVTPIIPVYPERSPRRAQSSHQITPIIPAHTNQNAVPLI